MTLPPSAPVTVLIVDDDQESSSAFQSALAENIEGIQVVTSPDGLDAMALLREGLRPSLILLDMMMPRCNGWLFLSLKQRECDTIVQIPVIVCSASANLHTIAAELNVAGFLEKPVQLDKLLATVRKWV